MENHTSKHVRRDYTDFFLYFYFQATLSTDITKTEKLGWR